MRWRWRACSSATPGISALAADTDGADGGAGSAADPAGAIIDHLTFAKMKSLGLDPKAYLANNDASAFFAATGDLLLTGPTLTNVNDIRVILVDQSSIGAGLGRRSALGLRLANSGTCLKIRHVKGAVHQVGL